jgi:hypothetical protein
MNPTPDPWKDLVDAARRAPTDQRAIVMPYGFAARVVARAFERTERPWLGLFEHLSWRALGVAGGLALASVALNFVPAVQAFEHDLIVEQDPVALVLELS